MLGEIAALPEDLGRPETLLANNGYISEATLAQAGWCTRSRFLSSSALW
jgi:hypothetical protein